MLIQILVVALAGSLSFLIYGGDKPQRRIKGVSYHTGDFDSW